MLHLLHLVMTLEFIYSIYMKVEICNISAILTIPLLPMATLGLPLLPLTILVWFLPGELTLVLLFGIDKYLAIDHQAVRIQC